MFNFRMFLPSFAKEIRNTLAKRRKKDRGITERLAFIGANWCYCGHFYKNARPRFAFSGCFYLSKSEQNNTTLNARHTQTNSAQAGYSGVTQEMIAHIYRVTGNPSASLVAPLVIFDLRTASEFSDTIRKFGVTSRCVCTLGLDVTRRRIGKWH